MDMKKGKKNKKIKGIALVIAGVLAATAYGGVQYHEKPKSTEVSVQVQESQHAAEAIKVKNISKKALNVKGKTRQSKNTEKNSNVVKYTVLDDSETVKITYKDGSVYEGNVDKNKKRSGQGTLWVTDGTTYTGEWKKDAINGKGECRTSDGSVLSGKFKKYSLKNGTYTYTDGKQSITRYIKKGKLTSQVHITVEGNNYDGSIRDGDDDDKIRLNQRKPSKYKGLRRFGPEKNLQRINKFMKERPIFYKNLIQMKENIRFYLRCFYCITKVMILQFNSENRTELARNG